MATAASNNVYSQTSQIKSSVLICSLLNFSYLLNTIRKLKASLKWEEMVWFLVIQVIEVWLYLEILLGILKVNLIIIPTLEHLSENPNAVIRLLVSFQLW